MGMFGLGKKKEIVDLGERYKRQQERTERIRQEAIQNSSKEGSENNEYSEDSENGDYDSPEEKKKKLAKRIADMSDKLDDLSTQIYHLQQRIEVVEQKTHIGVGG